MGRVKTVAACVCLALALVSGRALAAFPDHTVRMLVPFPAGGPADILARVVGERLSQVWNQPVIIENKPGANTAVGAVYAAKQPADGHNLFVVMDVTMVLNPLTTKSLPYDPRKDFTPITMLSKNTSLVLVDAETGPKSIDELVRLGRANPGKLNFGAGIITTRLAGELFNHETGIVAQYVPFQGSPPTVQALLSHSVDYIVDGQATSLPLIQAGKFRALAKLNDGPVSGLGDLQTLAVAAKAPALADISTWIGLVAPAATPPAVVEKIQKDVASVYADPAFIQKLLAAGINPVGSTPAAFSTFMDSETQRWGKVIREANIELN
jgi:tripartite-type tricarboxylate transporter receptor subunit TctC